MIDWDRVKELRSEVGAEDFAEVVDIFLEEVDEVIEKLQSNTSTATLAEDMHFLKGSSLNLGFASFSGLCRDGETSAASGHPEDVNLGNVFKSYAESKSIFLEQLKNW